MQCDAMLSPCRAQAVRKQKGAANLSPRLLDVIPIRS
jgi:hypothetical protein